MSRRNSVVLPTPFGPTTPTRSPDNNRSEKSLTMSRSPYRKVSSSSSRTRLPCREGSPISILIFPCLDAFRSRSSVARARARARRAFCLPVRAGGDRLAQASSFSRNLARFRSSASWRAARSARASRYSVYPPS